MHRTLALLARAAVVALVATVVVGVGGRVSVAAASSPCGHLRRPPAWHHIIVISFENHSYKDILGPSAPRSYFKTLAGKYDSSVSTMARK